MVANISLDGANELMKKIDWMEDRINRMANKVLREAAKPVAEAMRANVNVSNKDHVHIRDDIKISGVRTKEDTKYIDVGPGKDTAWRAKFLEFGTSHAPPYPFIEPAIRETKEEVKRILRESLKAGLGG
jgi:HK97 gp10 family phage protein